MNDGMSKWKSRDCFLLVLCVAYIALFCWLAVYDYPSPHEEYGSACWAREYEFWQIPKMWYQTVNGRVFYSLLFSLIPLLPMEASYPFFPPLTILLYAWAALHLLKTLFPHISLVKRMFWALLVTAVTLSFLFSLKETVYWQPGMPYFWSSALFLFSLSFAIRALSNERARGAFWACLVLCLLTGLILETSCVIQGAAAFFASLLYAFRGDRKRALMTGSFFLISVIAFFIIYLSPGTSIRMGGLVAVPFLQRLRRALTIAGVFGVFSLVKFFIRPILYVYLLFLPDITSVFSPMDERFSRRVRVWHVLIPLTLTACTMQFMGAWGLGNNLLTRVESLTLWTMGAIWVLFWAFFYRSETMTTRIRSSSLFSWRWGLLALCILFNSNSFALVRSLNLGPQYAAENRERDELMRQQGADGVTQAVVPSRTARPELLLYADLKAEPTFEDYARYYGVEEAIALPRALCEDKAMLARWEAGDFSTLEEIARQGDVDTQFTLGTLYSNVPADEERAMYWYEQASENGHNTAQRALASLYLHKGGGFRDYIRALYWFARSRLASLRF